MNSQPSPKLSGPPAPPSIGISALEQMSFSGQGWVLVQPSEGRVQAAQAGSGGGGAGGLLGQLGG